MRVPVLTRNQLEGALSRNDGLRRLARSMGIETHSRRGKPIDAGQLVEAILAELVVLAELDYRRAQLRGRSADFAFAAWCLALAEKEKKPKRGA